MHYTMVISHGCIFGLVDQVSKSIVSSVYSKLFDNTIPGRGRSTAFLIAKKTFSITKIYFLAFDYAIFEFCVHRNLCSGDRKRMFDFNQCAHDRLHTIWYLRKKTLYTKSVLETVVVHEILVLTALTSNEGSGLHGAFAARLHKVYMYIMTKIQTSSLVGTQHGR